jgi:hypothetical protein
MQVYSTAELQSWHKNLASFATNSTGNAPQNSTSTRSISELQVITWREARIDYATCTAVLSSYILLYKGHERPRRRSNSLHFLLDSILPTPKWAISPTRGISGACVELHVSFIVAFAERTPEDLQGGSSRQVSNVQRSPEAADLELLLNLVGNTGWYTRT